ncbi:arginine deiminase family protein [Methanofollis fontis]|uniref:Amidinotransferase n=1 Tax=Methanofollis fontis TaxID=2052832 RepID=A0A483CQ09_9EURY|nr:arginine deiminase family protein [Methanofollis fontis]TAJ44178.1 amidinotransferase [Methanofollis fontis]
MSAGAGAEWHRLQEVLVHEPGPEVFFALLNPDHHLYERFFNLDAAQREHRRLCEILQEDFGVRIRRLCTSILDGATAVPGVREGLLGCTSHLLEDTRPPVQERDPHHLLLAAILGSRPEGQDTALHGTMHNLYFMRDQQICTDLGMVSGRMATTERRHETRVTKLALTALGAGPVASVTEGHLEGGDFIPAGEFAMIGCGGRTTSAGISCLLQEGIGFDEVAVVHEPVHPLIGGRDYMVNMHLDTYCNICGDGIVVGNPALLNAATVDLHVREGAGYRFTGEKKSLKEFFAEKDFSIVPITTLEQVCYASNFLCVRDRECVAVDTGQIAPLMLERLRQRANTAPETWGHLCAQAERDYRRLRGEAEFFPYKREVYAEGLEMTPLGLKNATGGYGGAHCMTCPIRRG